MASVYSAVGTNGPHSPCEIAVRELPMRVDVTISGQTNMRVQFTLTKIAFADGRRPPITSGRRILRHVRNTLPDSHPTELVDSFHWPIPSGYLPPAMYERHDNILTVKLTHTDPGTGRLTMCEYSGPLLVERFISRETNARSHLRSYFSINLHSLEGIIYSDPDLDTPYEFCIEELRTAHGRYDSESHIRRMLVNMLPTLQHTCWECEPADHTMSVELQYAGVAVPGTHRVSLHGIML